MTLLLNDGGRPFYFILVILQTRPTLSTDETDAEKGSRQLLDQTAALLSANNDFSDRLDAILGELGQQDTPAVAADEDDNSDSDADPKQPSPKRAEPEAVS